MIIRYDFFSQLGKSRSVSTPALTDALSGEFGIENSGSRHCVKGLSHDSSGVNIVLSVVVGRLVVVGRSSRFPRDSAAERWASVGGVAVVPAHRLSGRGTRPTRGTRLSAVWRSPPPRRSADYTGRALRSDWRAQASSRSGLSDLQHRTNTSAGLRRSVTCPLDKCSRGAPSLSFP